MKRILIVEGESAIRRSIRSLLERQGYRVETAAHGAAGLEAVHWFHPDLVLLNAMTPVMDGFTMLEALGKERLPRMPRVVMMSGNGGPDRFETALSLGAVDYILHPVDPRDLTRAVGEALDPSLDDSQLAERARLRLPPLR